MVRETPMRGWRTFYKSIYRFFPPCGATAQRGLGPGGVRTRNTSKRAAADPRCLLLSDTNLISVLKTTQSNSRHRSHSTKARLVREFVSTLMRKYTYV